MHHSPHHRADSFEGHPRGRGHLQAAARGRPEGPRDAGRRGAGHGHGGRHRGSGRLFEHGALKLLALSLLAERPCHGYEIIKAIEGLVGGDYSPSPGVVYPTLSYLADVGWASAAEQEGGRRQYAITAAGREQLERQRDELKALLARLRGLRREAGARGAPEIERAMGNLKTALHLRFAGRAGDKALVRQVAELIDAAAVAIERL